MFIVGELWCYDEDVGVLGNEVGGELILSEFLFLSVLDCCVRVVSIMVFLLKGCGVG